MRKLGIVVATGLALAAPSPAPALDPGNGPATVTLPECALGSSQSDEPIAGCSYLYMAGREAPSYTYLTSQGAVTWGGGSVFSGVLSFPAAEQNWPTLAGLYGDLTYTWTPKDIAGRVDASGTVRLAMLYQVDIDIPEGIAAGTCTLSGIVELTSEGLTAYDPATGRFAVGSTNAFPPIPSINASCLRFATVDYDLLAGASWYLTGTMNLPPGTMPVVSPQRAQKARVKLPARIKPDGRTVLLKRAVRTNAGKRLQPTVSWSPDKRMFASVKVGKRGRVTITTTGAARRLRVQLALTAPGDERYLPYSSTRTWLVRRR